MDEQRYGEIAQALEKYVLNRGAMVFPLGHGTDICATLKQLFEDVVEKTKISKEEVIEWGLLFLKSVSDKK